MGEPKGSDVVLRQHLQDWGYGDLAIVPVLIRHDTITSFEERGGALSWTERLQVVRACKADLQTCLLGSPAVALPMKYLVIVPYSASTVLQAAFSSVVEAEEHAGNEAADGYEDSRYWTCVITGSLLAADAGGHRLGAGGAGAKGRASTSAASGAGKGKGKSKK